MPKLSMKRTKSMKSLRGGVKKTKSRKSFRGGVKLTKSRKSLRGGIKRKKSRKSLRGGMIGVVNPETYNYNDLYEEVLELLNNEGNLNESLIVKFTPEQMQNNRIKNLSITSFRVGAPLHIAAGINNLNLVRDLFMKGADIDYAMMDDERTPLFIACLKGHLDVARLLVEKGADINRADYTGATPLFIACLKGHLDVARLLVEKGADINRARDDGTTPLAIAKKHGHTNIIQLLKKPSVFSRFFIRKKKKTTNPEETPLINI
jgi:ankyrin repeat protein